MKETLVQTLALNTCPATGGGKSKCYINQPEYIRKLPKIKHLKKYII